MRRKGSVVWGHHGECGARAYNGGLGSQPPAGSRGRAPCLGLRGRSPPEAESILVIGCPTEPANLAPVRENSMFCYGPLVSELGGGPECIVPPNPVIGGAGAPPGSAAHGSELCPSLIRLSINSTLPNTRFGILLSRCVSLSAPFTLT